MMRWPSEYWAMSRGMSRSTIRIKTQPTWPEAVRTRYQSSMMGGGTAAGSAEVCVGSAGGVACAFGPAWVEAEAAVFACDGVPFVAAVEEGFMAFGGFFGAVARPRTSTFSPSVSW